MSPSPKNPLLQLLTSLQKSNDASYLILIQHSLALAQRQRAVSEVTDRAVYERAKVLAPPEQAQRDAFGQLWVSQLVDRYVGPHRVLWVETLTASRFRPSKCSFLGVGSNPLGWNEGEASTLGNLEELIRRISQSAEGGVSMIVLESLTPIVMRHGLQKAVVFLQKLLQSTCATIIIPVLIETFTPQQHRALEDLAQAVLLLQNGEAALLRHGVRERLNVVREIVAYEIDNENCLQLLSPAPSLPNSGNTVAASTTESPEPSSARPGKVTLRHEEEDSKLPAAPRPHIYMQDDDPEFEDLDEEDPDDDLDI